MAWCGGRVAGQESRWDEELPRSDLVASGDEQDMQVVQTADWIIDLGLEGGQGGGRIVVEGPPERVADDPASHTGRYLRELLETDEGVEMSWEVGDGLPRCPLFDVLDLSPPPFLSVRMDRCMRPAPPPRADRLGV